MSKFIGGFSTFLDIQNALVAEFYGVIHAIENVKRWVLLVYGLNVILP